MHHKVSPSVVTTLGLIVIFAYYSHSLLTQISCVTTRLNRNRSCFPLCYPSSAYQYVRRTATERYTVQDPGTASFVQQIELIESIWSAAIVQFDPATSSDLMTVTVPTNANIDIDSSLVRKYLNECAHLCNASQRNAPSSSETSSMAPSSHYASLTEHREHVLQCTMMWVQAMISDFSTCPFTYNAEQAGVPRGRVHYAVSAASTLSALILDYWRVLHHMMTSSVKEASTVILILSDEALLQSFTDFEQFTTVLEKAFDETSSEYASLGLHRHVSNVFFHPQYMFKDKDGQVLLVFDDLTGEVIGTSDEVPEPISYSRRSPFPVINILRAPMVRQAQRGTEQGKVFSDNIDRLNRVGRRNLQRMLDERDWTALPKLSAHHRPAVPKIDAASPSVSIPDEPADTTCQRDDAPMVEEDIMLMVDNWLQEQSSK